MRLGIISDTHIPERAKEIPKEILEDFKSVDMIIHLGDLIDLSVLKELKSACQDVKAVWGNMDPPEVRNELPQKEILKIENHKVGIMHGYGAPNNLIDLMTSSFKNDLVDIIIFGHSHTAFNKEINGILFFNPGSATDKEFSPYNSYGIIEINDKVEAKIVRI